MSKKYTEKTSRSRRKLQAPNSDRIKVELKNGWATIQMILPMEELMNEVVLAIENMASQELPVDIAGELVYFVGPTPARPGKVIGSAGPTSSSRMDAYSPALLAAGLRGMIGKGYRGPAVRQALVKYGAVHLAAPGGLGALLGTKITASEILAYEDLGPEAIRRLVVQDFPATVAYDPHGKNIYDRWLLPDRRIQPNQE